jgi:hypothetical protein
MHVIQKMLEPYYFFWSALKVPPSDSIQNMSQAPSKYLKQQIQVDKLDYFNSTWKILFVFGTDEYLERLEGKIRKYLFFHVEIYWNNSSESVEFQLTPSPLLLVHVVN